MYFALVSYPILGAGIKFIDDAFDEKKFSKILAVALAPLLGLLGAYTMLSDPVSATILLAIVAGVLLKGKIDNFAHVFGFSVALVIIILAGVQLLIVPLIVCALAALLDEVGNDVIDRKKDVIRMENCVHRFVVYFFDQRWVLKLVILGIGLAGVIPLTFFLAIVFFDGAYLLVRRYGRLKKEVTNGWFDDRVDTLKTVMMEPAQPKITRVAEFKPKPTMVYETRFFG